MTRTYVRTPLKDRFWSKVEKGPNDGCWEWTGAHYPNGYAMAAGEDRRPKYAHRVAVELSGREIPAGMFIDHLCRNRGCVNPAHLDVVTHQENVRRGNAGINSRRKTHCPQGHAYDDENTRWYRGARYCRACKRVAR